MSEKRLELRIEPFNKALVVQLIDMEGDFESTEHVITNKYNMPYLKSTGICLNGNSDLLVIKFMTNEERSAYESQLLNWISDELFNRAKSGVTWRAVGNIYIWDTEYREDENWEYESWIR